MAWREETPVTGIVRRTIFGEKAVMVTYTWRPRFTTAYDMFLTCGTVDVEPWWVHTFRNIIANHTSSNATATMIIRWLITGCLP